MEIEELKHFKTLYSIDCSEKVEKKSNGSVELSYLSWCYAWAEVKKLYPNANYDILKFGENKLPYVYDEKTGYMVFTRVEIEGVEHEMWLPVMDSANKAMKSEPYTYKVKKWNADEKKYGYVEKTVESATMFDINKTIMRCLTKNLAMFGLGLYIYAGEDLPENIEDEKEIKLEKEPGKEEIIYATEDQKERIKKKYSKDEIKEILLKLKRKNLSALTIEEASELLKEEEK